MRSLVRQGDGGLREVQGAHRGQGENLCLQEHAVASTYVDPLAASLRHRKSMNDKCLANQFHHPSTWQGSGECAGYFGDYVHCVDVCASKSLFKQLAEELELGAPINHRRSSPRFCSRPTLFVAGASLSLSPFQSSTNES
eukprot:scaffold229519_cov24-Tisochrysis_lutea.AAC.1